MAQSKQGHWRNHLVLGLSCLLCLAASGGRASSRKTNIGGPDTASSQLDRLGVSIESLEDQAYELSAQRFFQDPEDAEGARAGFYSSSIKVLRLAVNADSSNARALYHLGAALSKKSYDGFGVWDSALVREAVVVLERAQGHASGSYANLRPAIAKALTDSRQNLSSNK